MRLIPFLFDVQVKRLHEYKTSSLNILHVMHLYNQLKDNPDMEFYSQNLYFRGQGFRRFIIICKMII